ncbi:MAG: ferrous iron transporter B [Clostridia bacterium]|nr:ferrous iron transporter B [Clostridia bacterium]
MSTDKNFTVALAGNPNVGKSTVFNALTGMHQHTGNWPGKTVAGALGTFTVPAGRVTLVDLPGTYSLASHSPEEEVARKYICGESAGGGRLPPDAVIVVCDACCLERNLILALQVMNTGVPTVVCVNLMDEAGSRGITVDTDKLASLLGVPTVPCAARQGVGLEGLKEVLSKVLSSPVLRETREIDPVSEASLIAASCSERPADAASRDRRLDRILTGKFTAFPIMALLLAVVFFITLKGAGPLSDGLSFVLSHVENFVRGALIAVGVPESVTSAVCDGALRVLFWVVSVMLPPMAIFFPTFTFLEDLGYLPRVAYNLDGCFKKCGACGKQALTMMMGFGCNAAGVTGCRIIDSPRERLVAILTNGFVPCNGRFPVMAALISVLCALSGVKSGIFPTAVMCAAVALGITLTFAVSLLLSETVLRGEPSSFTLELPPYRAPRVGEVIVRSVFDRTLFVLGRAAAVAAPAGLVIWALGRVKIDSVPILEYLTSALDPIGRLAGMDGVILTAFMLALPAAEITLPLMMLGYASGGVISPVRSLGVLPAIFSANGWTAKTAVCVLIFTLVHWPCSTTIITVRRETGSVRWTLAAALIPTFIGYALCVLVNLIF